MTKSNVTLPIFWDCSAKRSRQKQIGVTEWDVGLPLKSVKGWLLYASGWFPYAASYFLIFRLQRSSYQQALLDAGLNVMPAALLGVGVFWLAGVPYSRIAASHTART